MALAAMASAGEWLADNDAGWPVYSETGLWTTSTSTGYAGGSYRYVVAPGGILRRPRLNNWMLHRGACCT
ncbi:MAG: hypothetical protein N2111_14545, partial [Candidatus Sumerlaeaceae bacterium]|nr:hypothetical protein [Candidatus Sumerlaeaceae bacterium]